MAALGELLGCSVGSWGPCKVFGVHFWCQNGGLWDWKIVEWVRLFWCICFLAEGEEVTLAFLLCCCALVFMCMVAAEWVWLCWCFVLLLRVCR